MMSRFTSLLIVCALAGCGTSEPPSPAPSATSPTKNPEAARSLIASGAVVIDVRSPDEYAGGHVPNAVNIPVEHVSGRLDEVSKLVAADKARPIVVYCAKGGRAAKAKQQLDAAGYTHVVNGGGYDDLH